MSTNLDLFKKLKSIKLVNTSTGRYYNSPAFPSVSTIIRKFEVSEYLEKWKQTVGESAAKAKGEKSALRGTRVHNAILNAFRGKAYPLDDNEIDYFTTVVPFLSKVKPVLMEQAIIWQKDPVSALYGFGGTPDILGEVSLSNFYHADKTLLSSDLGTTRLLMDYKTWAKPKYSQSLLSCCLQISAYTAGVNQCSNAHVSYRSNQGLIVGITPKTLYLYYLDADKINWYWEQFKLMVEAYHDKSATIHFNWKTFSFAAQDLFKTEAGKWEKGMDSRLPERLYMEFQLDSIRISKPKLKTKDSNTDNTKIVKTKTELENSTDVDTLITKVPFL